MGESIHATNSTTIEIQHPKHDTRGIRSKHTTMLLGLLVTFDEKSKLLVRKDSILVFLASNSIENPGEWPPNEDCNPHATPDDGPTIIAPNNSLSKDKVLRQNFREDCKDKIRNESSQPWIFGVPETLCNEGKVFATGNGADDQRT